MYAPGGGLTPVPVLCMVLAGDEGGARQHTTSSKRSKTSENLRFLDHL